MKSIVLLILVVVSISSNAQIVDTLNSNQSTKKINHEIGINATSLLKQVVSLSNTNLPVLPYDLTYKLIFKKSAIRIGFGVNYSNTSVKTTTTSSSQTGPNPIEEIPTTSKSTNIFYRVGWEKRYPVHSRLMVCWGADIIGQVGNSSAQSSTSFNNLPQSFSQTKSNDDTKLTGVGLGVVGGFQFFISKRISVYTEVPLYLQQIHQVTISEVNQSNYNNFNGWTYSYNKQEQTTNSTKISLTLPVTVYLAIKF
jgi:hypothetical protein